MTSLDPDRDINDIFEDIVLTEERVSKQSYEEGFRDGVEEGNAECYKLGYAQGVDLGEELGTIYGTIIAHLNTHQHSPRVRKTLESLKATIDVFPRTNDPEVDIIGQIQAIRLQYKKLKAMLRLPIDERSPEHKDLSF